MTSRVTSNDGKSDKKITSKKPSKTVKVSEERQLVLEIVETASMAGAQLLLNKLRKRFGS